MSKPKTINLDPAELKKLGESMTFESIAKIMGCSTSTVRNCFKDMRIPKRDLRAEEAVFIPE